MRYLPMVVPIMTPPQPSHSWQTASHYPIERRIGLWFCEFFFEPVHTGFNGAADDLWMKQTRRRG